MFSLKTKQSLDKSIHKTDFIKYSPNAFSTVNNIYSKISINLPREDAYIFLQNSYITVDFEVLTHAEDTRYFNNDAIGLVIFRPVALFSEANLTLSSGKHLEKVDNLHVISLMYTY